MGCIAEKRAFRFDGCNTPKGAAYIKVTINECNKKHKQPRE